MLPHLDAALSAVDAAFHFGHDVLGYLGDAVRGRRMRGHLLQELRFTIGLRLELATGKKIVALNGFALGFLQSY